MASHHNEGEGELKIWQSGILLNSSGISVNVHDCQNLHHKQVFCYQHAVFCNCGKECPLERAQSWDS